MTLRLSTKRVPARGPITVGVSNANRFRVDGRLSGETAKRIILGGKRRRVTLRAKAISVPAAGKRRTGKR